MKWYDIVKKYFGVVFLAGLLIGFFFPDFFMPLSRVTLIILGVIITLSFLTLDYERFFKTLKQFYIPLAVFVLYKLLVPAGLYFLASQWQRNIGLAVLLLAATPIGMITPPLAQIVGGDRGFVLALVIITSFASPFYLPFLIKFVGGAYIELDPVSMMFSLVKLIFIPLAVSLVLRKFAGKLIRKTEDTHGALSILLLFFVLLGIGAQGASYIKTNLVSSAVFLGASFILCTVLALLGFFGFWFLDKERRVGLAVSIPYMNLALSIVIASRFFAPEVLLFCIVYEVPGNLLPVVLRRIGRPSRREIG